MTVADTVGTEALQEQAHRHLLMHFTRNGVVRPGRQAAARARARRGRLRVRHGRQPLLRRAVVAVLLPDRLLLRRGDGRGGRPQQLSTLAFNTNWATAHPPAIRLAAALADRAPGDLNRVFFTNGGSESVEAAWKIVRQHYLAKGEPQRTKAIAREIAYHGVTLGALSLYWRPYVQGALWRGADPGRARVQHEPLPRPRRRRRRGADAPACWTRWSARSSRPARRPWRW